MSGSAEARLVQVWEQAFQKKDLALFEKCLHKDYRHLTHPKSINQGPQAKEEFVKRVGQVFSECTEIVSTIHSITEAPGKVTIHLTNVMKTTSGVTSSYETLVIATVVTDDEGNLKIKQVDEFGDSHAYLERKKSFPHV